MPKRQNPPPLPGEGLPVDGSIPPDGDAPGQADVRREIQARTSAELGRDLAAIREVPPSCWPPSSCSALEYRLAVIREELAAREWRL